VEVKLHLNSSHYTYWSNQAPGTAVQFLSQQFTDKYLKVKFLSYSKLGSQKNLRPPIHYNDQAVGFKNKHILVIHSTCATFIGSRWEMDKWPLLLEVLRSQEVASNHKRQMSLKIHQSLESGLRTNAAHEN